MSNDTPALAGWTVTPPSRADIYQRITDQIVAAIEAGTTAGGGWRMPWHAGAADGHPSVLPVNAATGAAYRGVNILALWAAAQAALYPSPVWGTYRQWRELGAQVRKGEQASPIVFWRPLDAVRRDGTDDAGTDEAAGDHRRLLARGYAVFNASQVEGYTVPTPPVLPETQRIARAETFFTALGATVIHGGARACYVPAQDLIRMPAFAAFRDAGAYYATLAHETTHWAGHPRRCARDLAGRFGSEAYAAEELVAELGAAFLCAHLRLSAEPRPDHAAYVASWLRVLRADKRAVFTAAAKAQQAADWLTQTAQPDDTPAPTPL